MFYVLQQLLYVTVVKNKNLHHFLLQCKLNDEARNEMNQSIYNILTELEVFTLLRIFRFLLLILIT